jgi:hypothetical protein
VNRLIRTKSTFFKLTMTLWKCRFTSCLSNAMCAWALRSIRYDMRINFDSIYLTNSQVLKLTLLFNKYFPFMTLHWLIIKCWEVKDAIYKTLTCTDATHASSSSIWTCFSLSNLEPYFVKFSIWLVQLRCCTIWIFFGHVFNFILETS